MLDSNLLTVMLPVLNCVDVAVASRIAGPPVNQTSLTSEVDESPVYAKDAEYIPVST